jgi:putative transposase
VEAGIESSVGSVGYGYANGLAETIDELYKAEGIHRAVPGDQWKPSSLQHCNG